MSEHSDDRVASRRPSHEVEQSHKRAKRSRYISIACNECKRRKIKCNGETLCRRCGHLDLQCVYTPNAVHNFKETQEFQQMSSQINNLQQAVESLTANMGYVRPHDGAIPVPPSPASIQTSNRLKPYTSSAATSAAVTLAVIPIDSSLDSPQNSGHVSFPYTSYARYVHPVKDPIWTFQKEETLRLFSLWKDTIHPTLPILNLDRTIQHIDMLYAFLDDTRRSDPIITQLPGADVASNTDAQKLKLVLATAMAIEGSSDGDVGCKLFTSAITASEQLLYKPVSLENLELLVLSAICAFHKDDEHLAWRLIGLCARMLFEYGINNNYTFEAMLPKRTEAFRATILIWVIFVLDRRLSLLNSLPSALKEDDIDHFKPDSIYFFRLIELVEVSWKILPSLCSRQHRHLSKILEAVKEADTDIRKWYFSLPESIQYNSSAALPVNSHASQNLTPIFLFLRTSQTRIAVSHPIFLSRGILTSNMDIAKTIVDVARDSVQTVKLLISLPPYFSQCRIAKYFLMSALAIIFLASMRAASQFKSTCRETFGLALDMMCIEKPDSFIGKRLLRTLKVLAQVGRILSTSSPTGLEATTKSSPYTGDIPPEMMSPMHQKPPQFLINDCLDPNDNLDDLANRLLTIYDTSAQGQDQDLREYDALTKIFRDLF